MANFSEAGSCGNTISRAAEPLYLLTDANTLPPVSATGPLRATIVEAAPSMASEYERWLEFDRYRVVTAAFGGVHVMPSWSKRNAS